MNTQKAIKDFSRKLVFFTAILVGVVFIFDFGVPSIPIISFTPFIILFFFIITLLLYVILIRLTSQKPGKFISGFMLTTTVKLILYTIVLFAYSFSNPAQAIPFILTFFILYLFYTIFEVILILPGIKNASGSEQK